MNDLGKRIRQRREELNISQVELAKKLGYKSRSTIAKIESGTNDVSQTKIKEFAEALYTSTAWLMGMSNYSDDIDQIGHDIDVLDAKVYFHYLLDKLIEKFGYTNIDNFAEDKDGDTTIVFEGEKEKFEIKQKSYDEFLNNCFSFIDYNFHKLIDEKNRVQSDYFIYCFLTERTTKEPFEIIKEYFDAQEKESNK